MVPLIWNVATYGALVATMPVAGEMDIPVTVTSNGSEPELLLLPACPELLLELERPPELLPLEELPPLEALFPEEPLLPERPPDDVVSSSSSEEPYLRSSPSDEISEQAIEPCTRRNTPARKKERLRMT